MNILYVNTQKMDYSQDILYAGLRQNASIALYEYPFNKRYHLPLKPYPKNLGLVKTDPLAALLRPIPWQKIQVVVLAACHPVVLRHYEAIYPKLPQNHRLVFVDGGDRPEVGGDFERLGGAEDFRKFSGKFTFNLIFKREMLLRASYPENCRAFPFGFNTLRLRGLKPVAKKYDVSFWAVESDPVRTRALQLLENEFDCRRNGTVRNQVFSQYKRKGQFYLEELRACRVVLNLRGSGWDTLRYWETPAVGSFMVSQRPGIVIPNDFISGKHIAVVDHPEEIVAICRYYLAHPEEREAMAAAAHSHLLEFHSETARAVYFLQEIRAAFPEITSSAASG